jgi:type IV pilus assembly protein PilA
MKTHSTRRGFTYVELLFVLATVAMMLAIGLPGYIRAQTHARQSEAITQLKSLSTSLQAQQNPPFSIHLRGFNPPRGNRYSYHTSNYCYSYEDRSTLYAVQNTMDDCIGVDTYQHHSFPSIFSPVLITDYYWFYDGEWGYEPSNLGNSAGILGTCGDPQWEYLIYAAGDVDDDPSGSADTWVAASADGYLSPVCPSTAPVEVAAGEPFMVYDDADCN